MEPAVLRWARESATVTLEWAAAKIERPWIATAGSPGLLELLDPATLHVMTTVPVGTTTSPEATSTCDRPISMAEGNGFLWVTNVDDGTLSEVSVSSRTGVATVPVGKLPTGVAVGFGSVWVTVAG